MDDSADSLTAALTHYGIQVTADQADRLGRVPRAHIFRVDAPTVRVSDGVVGIEATGDLDRIPQGLADPSDRLPEESRAVFVGPAVAAVLARERGEQFADEVPVAALDVDGVEAGLSRPSSRLNIGILEGVQLLIRNQRMVGGDGRC